MSPRLHEATRDSRQLSPYIGTNATSLTDLLIGNYGTVETHLDRVEELLVVPQLTDYE